MCPMLTLLRNQDQKNQLVRSSEEKNSKALHALKVFRDALENIDSTSTLEPSIVRKRKHSENGE